MRKTYSPEFKAKLVMEVFRGERLFREIASENTRHRYGQWRECHPGKTSICAQLQQPQGLGLLRMHEHFHVRKGDSGSIHAALGISRLISDSQKAIWSCGRNATATLLDSVREYYHASDAQVAELVSFFVSKLPENWKNRFQIPKVA